MAEPRRQGGQRLENLHEALSLLTIMHAVAGKNKNVRVLASGGLARLSAEELALYPPGPAETRLSRARRGSGAGG